MIVLDTFVNEFKTILHLMQIKHNYVQRYLAIHCSSGTLVSMFILLLCNYHDNYICHEAQKQKNNCEKIKKQLKSIYFKMFACSYA